MSTNGENQNKSYPALPVKHWWALRRQFRKSIPQTLSTGFVASVLDMKESSARANVLGPMKLLGIIGEDGKPTERAVKWRDDGHYAEVCEAIRKEVYPNELITIASDGNVDRAQVERWFANHTGNGEAAVRRMAALYVVLCEADPTKEAEVAEVKKDPAKQTPRPRRSKKPSTESGSSVESTKEQSPKSPITERQTTSSVPSIHFNIQVHISPDSTPEQIDQVFASMAKHLKQLGE